MFEKPARYYWRAAICAATLLAPCGPALAQDAPAAPPCTLLAGGAHTVTPNADVNSRWFVINRVISQDVESSLTQKGYKIAEYIADIPDPSKRLGGIVQQLDQTKCAKVIQVFTLLKGSAAAPNTISQFSVGILVFHLVRNSTSNVSVASEYQKAYTYPLTSDMMQNLSMSALGAQIAADVDAAGVLAKAN